MTEDKTEEAAGEALEALQALDDEIQRAEERVRGVAPRLDEVEEPALALESEVEATRERLKEMRLAERRLETSADEKRARADKLEGRLNEVRNVREEAAVKTELDMVRKALGGDEQEALTLLDQIRKLEDRLEEQEAELEQAREEIEPRRQELVAERDELQQSLEQLRERRGSFSSDMAEGELRIYERIRGAKGRRAVSRLMPDGACGNCFNVLPLQLQNEIRHGSDMVRCEACGVILTAAERDEEEAQA